MGPDKTCSVVDARLKVHGIDGLRVADASVMPFVVSGNLNGPSMMIGQRASEIILSDATA
jgi:choline dehydrogenase